MSGARRRSRCPWLRAALLAVLARSGASAQDAPDAAATVVRVGVSVTAVAGSNAYLDKGRLDHIEQGDVVLLQPVGAGEVQGVVRMVTRASCRVELPADVTSIAVGDRGEVLVPKARVDAAAAAPADGGAPEHGPWTLQDDGYAQDQPLLAPAVGQAPEDRPMEVHGRFYFNFNGTWDHEHDNAYQLWQTGVDVTVDNPLGDGGQAHLQGEQFHHVTNIGNGPDDSTDLFTLDSASYAWGGTRERPDRYEVGRFLQDEFPELGVLDGVEATHRLSSGDRVGGSFGYMPEFFPDMKTGHELQAAVFYRADGGGAAPVGWGVAYQNTWHDGAQDRNLFVGDFDAALGKDVSLAGEALVDYYGPGGDTIKNDGFQLTEAHLSTRWRLDPHYGVGLHASQMRWPEQKRDEFGDVSPEEVADGVVTRAGVDGWKDLTESLRVDSRVDAWQDQDQDGASGDVRAALREWFWTRGDVSLDVFVTSGAFTDGQGVRLAATRSFESLGYGRLSWEISNYTSNQTSGSTDTTQQALRASLDRPIGRNWSASFYAESRSGDGTGSISVGVFLQERF